MSWKRFDKVLLSFNRGFDKNLDRVVRPGKKLYHGRSFFDLAMKQLELPKKRRRW
jgi:hypothetical protein